MNKLDGQKPMRKFKICLKVHAEFSIALDRLVHNKRFFNTIANIY